MNYIKGQHIYKVCSKITKTALEEYCNQINKSDADIFVVMAQKAICLFRLLIDHGLINEKFKDKCIVTNTALNFDNDICKNKKVAVIEDIMISGSAITSMLSKLGNAKEVKVYVLAIDQDYQSVDFTSKENNKNLVVCNCTMKDEECIELSYEVARLIAFYGNPYDTDFPEYQKTQINSSYLSDILNPLHGEINNITNDVQNRSDIKALTIFPNDRIINITYKQIGLENNGIIHFKLRVYIQKFNNGSQYIRFVPMAMFNEISKSDINMLFSKNFSQFENQCVKWTELEKFRFLQFYISNLFFNNFISLKKYKYDFKMDNNKINQIFGTQSNLINNMLLSNIKTEKDIHSIDFTEPSLLEYFENNENKKQYKFDELNSFELNEFIYSIFLWRYYNKELPSRNKMKKLKLHYLEDCKTIVDESKRLNEGFSLNALCKIMNKKFGLDKQEKVISVFLDRAIDNGMIVPIIYINGNKVCRAYRHGEDLPFGEADKCRLLYFLKYFNKFIINNHLSTELATVTMEKIIVLFYQIGLRNGNIFNRFLGFDNFPLLKESYSVHGKIEICDENNTQKHVYYEKVQNKNSYSNWLTNWLQSKDVIVFTKHNNKSHYYIHQSTIENLLNNNLNNVCNTIKKQIKNIATTIGNLYLVNINQKDNFKSDIIALTSCLDIYTYSSSIITELHYFYRYYNKQICSGIDKILNGCYDDEFNYSTTEQALKSARDKADWYYNNRAVDVINNASNNLSKLNYDTTLWDEAWQIVKIKKYNDKLEILAKESLMFLYFYSACYEWLNSGRLIAPQNYTDSFIDSNKNIKEYFEKYSECKTEPFKKMNLFKTFEDIEKINNLSDRLEKFDEFIKNVLKITEEIVKKTELELSNDLRSSYNIRYDACIIIEIESDDYLDTNQIFMKLWDYLPDDVAKTNINIINLDKNSNWKKYGVFFDRASLIKKRININTLYFNIYEKIKIQLNERAYKTKIAFIPNLPYPCEFKHDIYENIYKYSQEFSDSVLNKLDNIFDNHNSSECINQTIFIETLDTDRKFINKVNLMFGNNEVENNNLSLGWNCFPNYHLYEFNAKLFGVDKIDKSPVLILSDENIIGSGFLFKYKNIVYCVSCQHILNDNKPIYAITKIDNIKFKINPINKRDQVISSFFNVDSSEDVLIFKPDFKETLFFDSDNIFSESDCIDNSFSKYTYKGYGYIDQSKISVVAQNLKYVDNTGLGYYQVNDVDNYTDEGFSGAAIYNDNGKILGMHQSRFTVGNHVIPISVIINILEEAYKKDMEGEI